MQWQRLVCGLSLSVIVAACEPPPDAPPPPAKVPVISEIVESGPFQARLRLLGTVQASQRVELRTLERGKAIRYANRFAAGLRGGELVERGELLFVVENDDLSLAAAEAELQAQAAESELERARRGVEGGFLPQMELKNREIQRSLAQERLANARSKVARLRHVAPASGVLSVEAMTPPGVEVSAGLLLAHLSGRGRPVIEAWAAASDQPLLEAGLRVECVSSAGGRVVGRGQLREVAPEIDAVGTVRVVAEIDEDLGLPRPGEGIELEVLLPARAGVVTVPEEALLTQGGVSRAFVLTPSGADYKAELRVVQTGQRSAGRVEVIYGLQADERLAVRGAEFLADGLLAVEAQEGGS